MTGRHKKSAPYYTDTQTRTHTNERSRWQTHACMHTEWGQRLLWKVIQPPDVLARSQTTILMGLRLHMCVREWQRESPIVLKAAKMSPLPQQMYASNKATYSEMRQIASYFTQTHTSKLHFYIILFKKNGIIDNSAHVHKNTATWNKEAVAGDNAIWLQDMR